MPEAPTAPQNEIPQNAIPATAQAANAGPMLDQGPGGPGSTGQPQIVANDTDTPEDVNGDGNGDGGTDEQGKAKKQKSQRKMGDNEVFVRDRQETREEEIIYISKEKGCLYMNFCRFFWCGCFEPYQRITSHYVEETSWHCCCSDKCGQVTESIAFENVMDVSREQSCLCSCLSFMPCCCCVEDMANIVLFGTDASEKQQHGEEKQKMVLERVSHSFRVFETLTAHLQRTHKLWRKQGRIYKRKVEQLQHI